jgi:hypothetical protein
LKQNEKIGNETKRNEQFLEAKQSENTLWSEANNLKRKEAKIFFFFSQERAKRM